jgi:ATPase family AAA domain-containing protein 3A/B
LRRRAGDELISENLRNSINAFLFRTGTPSSKVIVVLATNAPSLLDEALQDRMDEIVHFQRPDLNDRIALLKLYINQYTNPSITLKEKIKFILKHPTSVFFGKKIVDSSIMKDEYLKSIALRTEGFSCREISKLVASWNDAAFAKENAVLDKETSEKIINRQVEQKKIKENWNVSQKEYFNVMHPKH